MNKRDIRIASIKNAITGIKESLDEARDELLETKKELDYMSKELQICANDMVDVVIFGDDCQDDLNLFKSNATDYQRQAEDYQCAWNTVEELEKDLKEYEVKLARFKK